MFYTNFFQLFFRRYIIILKKHSFGYIFPAFLTFLYVSGLLLFPENVCETVKNSLVICFTSVIPSLFPFLIASNLIIHMKYFDFFGNALYKIMPKLFSVSGRFSPALILGFIGGYPIGGATTVSVYNAENSLKKDAERALGFCNNCSPAFILGTVGNTYFHSGKLGFMLLTIHITAAILTGILFKIFIFSEKSTESYTSCSLQQSPPSFSEGFTRAVAFSLKSILSVSAYIVFFSVFISLLRESGLLNSFSSFFSKCFGVDAKIVSAFLSGIFEMTSGIFSLPSDLNTATTFVLTSFFLGWGGFSVHFQTQSMMTGSSLSMKNYYIGKLLHGVLSLIIALSAAILIL